MRTLLALLLTLAIATSSVTPWSDAAARTLPPCCKAHGCAMKKQCAFASCDRQAPDAKTEKQPLAVIARGIVSLREFPSHSFTPVMRIEALALVTTEIDHPPRLLFV